MQIQDIIAIAKDAGKEILKVYNTEFSVETKEDNSPLTEADKRANELIVSRLKELAPQIPILAEESKQIPYKKRKDWKELWLVDPLDGTKEFVKKNGEFTVNIALVKDGKPVLGVVYVPVTGECYWADDSGAFKNDKLIHARNAGEKIMVVASKSHFTDETREYVEQLGKEYELVNKGSSLKICLIAEGKADLYPRLGPTMEWDTAAAHAIVNKAGRKVMVYGKDYELSYNKEELTNGWFVVR